MAAQRRHPALEGVPGEGRRMLIWGRSAWGGGERLHLLIRARVTWWQHNFFRTVETGHTPQSYFRNPRIWRLRL